MFLLRKCIAILESINQHLANIESNTDRTLKRISVLHNQSNIKNPKPLAWLTPEERAKANELREKDPSTYEYVIEFLKLFLGGEDAKNFSKKGGLYIENEINVPIEVVKAEGQKNRVIIHVDTHEIDMAIEKARELETILKDCNKLYAETQFNPQEL